MGTAPRRPSARRGRGLRDGRAHRWRHVARGPLHRPRGPGSPPRGRGRFLLWHLFSLGAVRVVTPIRATAVNVVAVVVAVAIVVGPQVVLGSVTADARNAAAEIFQPVAEGGAWVPDPAAAGGVWRTGLRDHPLRGPSLDPSASASLEPSASPTPEVPRINVLLIGIDSGVGRNTALTDTMIVASLDPVGKTVSMVSIPRDMVDVPLPDGRSFRGKINRLVSFARWNPKKFPGAKDGQSVLAAALGELLDLKIDKWAQVNLAGFVDLVDSVGGMNVTVTDGFCDPPVQGVRHQGLQHLARPLPLRWRTGPRLCARAQGRRRARLHPGRPAAGGHRGRCGTRSSRAGFLENPGKFLKSLGQTIQTNIKPGVHRGLDRRRLARSAAKDDFRDRHRPPLVQAAPTTSGAASRTRTSRRSARWRSACSRRTGRAPRGLRHDACRRFRANEARRVVQHLRHRAHPGRRPSRRRNRRPSPAHAQADRRTDRRAHGGADARRPRPSRRHPNPEP